jgi:hypothetical protein
MPTLLVLLIHLGLQATVLADDAAPGCRVELWPADAPTAWVSAASALQRTLRAAPASDRDCRQVLIRATPEHASVEVTTRDGRRGVRLLGDAREVEPTVSALIVTVPDEVAIEKPAASPPTRARWQPLIVAAGGARLTLPGTPASTIAVAGGVVRGPWELALYGSWSPAVLGASAAAKSIFSSTAELGLGAARRQPLGSVALLAGVRVGAIRLSPNDAGSNAAQTGDNVDLGGPAVAAAVSAFAGTAVPLFSFLRLRPELSAQWIPPGWTGTDVRMSLWSLGLSLGAESSLP